MADELNYLRHAKDALGEIKSLGPDLSKAIAKGEEQAKTRDAVIETINEMCDALQLAADLLAKQISTAVIEFSRLQHEGEAELRGYFGRSALALSEPALGKLLSEGAVCGALHKLGDRFRQPFSKETTGAVSFWENVKTFFARSNTMSTVLHGLLEGERDYLRDFSALLKEVRSRAESALLVPPGHPDKLRLQGLDLLCVMREKRASLQKMLMEIRSAADGALRSLH